MMHELLSFFVELLLIALGLLLILSAGEQEQLRREKSSEGATQALAWEMLLVLWEYHDQRMTRSTLYSELTKGAANDDNALIDAHFQAAWELLCFERGHAQSEYYGAIEPVIQISAKGQFAVLRAESQDKREKGVA